jgi:hypothetical protein
MGVFHVVGIRVLDVGQRRADQRDVEWLQRQRPRRGAVHKRSCARSAPPRSRHSRARARGIRRRCCCCCSRRRRRCRGGGGGPGWRPRSKAGAQTEHSTTVRRARRPSSRSCGAPPVRLSAPPPARGPSVASEEECVALEDELSILKQVGRPSLRSAAGSRPTEARRGAARAGRRKACSRSLHLVPRSHTVRRLKAAAQRSTRHCTSSTSHLRAARHRSKPRRWPDSESSYKSMILRRLS